MEYFVRPCLPSDYDRFSAPKPGQPAGRPWVVTSPGFGDPRGDMTEDIGAYTTTHPEGSRILFASCVVSSQPVDETLEELGQSLLERAGLKSDGCSATAFLMPDGPGVWYYLVDHTTKTVTWADGDSAPDAVSVAEPRRAQNMLCEEYWMHMENFPAPVSASVGDLRQLKVVLASLAIGEFMKLLVYLNSSTSDGSTSPFSSTQIQEILAMLNTFSDTIEEFQTWAIARLWCVIWRARVVNNFGMPEARLDRFTMLAEQPPVIGRPWVKLFVGADADAHLTRCSRAWAGRIAYVTEWRNFKSKNELEWTLIMFLACFLIIASLLVRSESTCWLTPNIAVAFGCASVVNSYHLISESQNLGEHAVDASVHFQRWETAKFGVQGLALRNAAPRALLLWGFVIFLLAVF